MDGHNLDGHYCGQFRVNYARSEEITSDKHKVDLFYKVHLYSRLSNIRELSKQQP